MDILQALAANQATQGSPNGSEPNVEERVEWWEMEDRVN